MKTTEQHSNVVIRYIFLTIGAISFCLGTAGIVLPILPTVPFYMLTLFCSILASVTTIMLIGAYFSRNIPVALIIMAIVWIAHVIVLLFIVKTKNS